MSLPLAGAGRRLRISTKTAPPPWHPSVIALRAALNAIRDEGWSELISLEPNARRKHMHFVHVRTANAADRQPETFTRAEFFDFLVLVYKDVYPEVANYHSCAVLFGIVAKEMGHPGAREDCMLHEHNHVALYCSIQHYWNPVVRRAAELNVKLHAAKHDGYSSMYNYLRKASSSKPWSEVDQEPFLSIHHPRGDALSRLLLAGERSATCRKGKGGGKGDAPNGVTAAAADVSRKRFRSGDIFALSKSNGIKTARALQDHARVEDTAGRPELAEFCTAVGALKLQEMIDSAQEILNPPLLDSGTLVGKLEAAARSLPCVCSGTWAPGALLVLRNNGVCHMQFSANVVRALRLGAVRGANIQIVGPPGLGKSMLFEPFERIFTVFGKPARDNPYCFGELPGADVLLWQDFKYSPRIVLFEDLLSMMVGESMEFRVFRKGTVKHRNNAPLFVTALKLLHVQREDAQETAELNQAMDERFTIYNWNVPLPMHQRIMNFPKCGCCCARFYRESAAAVSNAAASSSNGVAVMPAVPAAS